MLGNPKSEGQPVSRRRFVGSALAVAALSQSTNPDDRAVATTAPRAEAVRPPKQCESAGLLAARVRLTVDRLLTGQVPEFSREFVLADVALTPARRFNEYSGDLSGRYVEALAALPAGESPERLRGLVAELIGFQRADGRFGDPDLIFKADQIGPKHMALLWGNGRLLVGLLQYYGRSGDEKVLEAAQRLGRFLLAVREECSAPAVLKRLEGQGASGYICFTQLIEGLMLLKRATGSAVLLEAASSIVPLLPPRGIQHAHGYLSTLRGVAMLNEETKDPKHLAFVEDAYRDLVNSADFTAFGSVLEYFGWRSPDRAERDSSVIVQNSGKEPRDEGCGHADFVRLSLQLWRQTGKLDYLERAEGCLWNGFFFNQFPTGDFGHHVCAGAGVKPTDNLARAWWCCTMHGYRAFPDILEAVVTEAVDGIRMNLFEEVDWFNGSMGLKLRRSTPPGKTEGWRFSVECTQTGGEPRLLEVRIPRWADRTELLLNGEPFSFKIRSGYASVRRRWVPGDRLELVFGCRLALKLADGTLIRPVELTERPVQALLTLGPWLMCVDSARDPLFFGEPWQDNVLSLGDAYSSAPSADSADPSIGLALELGYTHGGFPGRRRLTMRPVADAYRHEAAILAFSLKFRA
jgi:hypothetical protein